MSYTITRHDGVRFTLCPPGVSAGAYTVEADQYVRRHGAINWAAAYVFSGNRPLSEAELARRSKNASYMRKKQELKESRTSPASAEAQPNSE